MSDRIVVMDDGEIQQFAPPEEVYHRPNNEFVGHFIGTPSMNFFDAELVGEGDDLRADLGFAEVPIDPSEADRPLSAGDAVRLGVRPEHLDLEADDPEGFEAHVKFVEPTGKDKIVHLDVGVDDFKAIVAGDVSIGDDEARHVTIRSEQILLFDADSGECIY